MSLSRGTLAKLCREVCPPSCFPKQVTAKWMIDWDAFHDDDSDAIWVCLSVFVYEPTCRMHQLRLAIDGQVWRVFSRTGNRSIVADALVHITGCLRILMLDVVGYRPKKKPTRTFRSRLRPKRKGRRVR